MSATPLVNAWTEWGPLELVCLGRAEGACYPDSDPFCYYNYIHDTHLAKYASVLGPRPKGRIDKAVEELAYLADILEAESVSVSTFSELDPDIKKELTRTRAKVSNKSEEQSDAAKFICKPKSQVIRPTKQKFDHLLMTPWFKNYYQFGMACPRDMVITFGNTILEAPTASRVRFFESCLYRDIIYPLWVSDRSIHWKAAPQPSCDDSMFQLGYWEASEEDLQREFKATGYKTSLLENEVAFDAADMMRCGKDIFYKKNCSANNLGMEWLRREFPELRFHMMHFPNDFSPHLDVNLIPLRPPSSGSEGLVLINKNSPPLKSEMDLWIANDWKPIFAPLPITNEVSPVGICSANLNMNLLSVSEQCVIIEESEREMESFLQDLQFDVIGVPLRSLNEFGGGVHCVTWDIRRQDSCKDYFPQQDYEAERNIDYNHFYDKEEFH